jgi:hypothetical protein
MSNVGAVTVTESYDPMTSGVGASPGWQTHSWIVTFDAALGPLPLSMLDFVVSDLDTSIITNTPGSTVPARGVNWEMGYSLASIAGTSPLGLCNSGNAATCGVTPAIAKVAAGTPYTYTITGLTPGTPYYVEVFARNALGLGRPTVSSPLFAAPPVQAPDAPRSPFSISGAPIVTTLSATTLRVAYAPAFDGGDPIIAYRIEWDSAATFNSALDGTPLGTAFVQAPSTVTDFPHEHQEYTIPVQPDAIAVTRFAPYGRALQVNGISTINASDAVPLPTGTPIYVRVSAFNEARRFGPSALAVAAPIVPRSKPAKPLSPVLSIVDQSTLVVNWSAPEGNGAPITAYLVEAFERSYSVAAAAPTSDLSTCDNFGCREVQTVTIVESALPPVNAVIRDLNRNGILTDDDDSFLDGTFTLGFGEFKKPLPGSATLSVSQSFVLSLPPGSPLTGSFTLGWNTLSCAASAVRSSEVSSPLPVDASSDLITLALGSLKNLGPSAVSVSRTGDGSTNSSTWTVNFLSSAYPASCALPLITIAASALPAGASLPSVASLSATLRTSADWTTTLRRCDQFAIGSQTFSVHASSTYTSQVVSLASVSDCAVATLPTSGSLSNLTAMARETTVALSPWDSADFVAAALNDLPSLGLVAVSKGVQASANSPDRVSFMVTFIGSAPTNGALPNLFLNGHGLFAADSSASIVSKYVSAVLPDAYTSQIVNATAGLKMSARVSGRKPGVLTYVRVSAINDRGAGVAAPASPWGLKPVGVPSSPLAVRLLPWTASSLLIEWDSTVQSTGGEAPTSWRVDLAPTPTFVNASTSTVSGSADIQRISTFAATDGITGSFRLALGGFHGVYSRPVGSASCRFDVFSGGSVLIVSSYPGTICLDTRSLISPRDTIKVGDVEVRVGNASRFTATTIPLASLADADAPFFWPGPVLRAVTVYSLSTSLGSVSVDHKSSVFTAQWSSGVIHSLSNWRSESPVVRDLVRFGNPETGPTFRVKSFIPGSGALTVCAADDETCLTPATYDDVAAAIGDRRGADGQNRAFFPLYALETTVLLKADVPSPVLAAALSALPSVGTVTVSPRIVIANGFSWTVTFPAYGRASTLPLLTYSNLSATAGGIAGVSIVTIGRKVFDGLALGTPYFASVSAVNSAGASVRAISTPPSKAPAATAPRAPSDVIMLPASDSALLVEWSAPEHDGGDRVSRYWVEWDPTPSFNSVVNPVTKASSSAGSLYIDSALSAPIADIHILRVSVEEVDGSGRPYSLAGSFALSFDGLMSAHVPADATAGQVKAALESIPGVGIVNVARSVIGSGYGFSWTIEFTTSAGSMAGRLAAISDNLISLPSGGRVSLALDARFETQAIVCSGLIANGFTLSWRGTTTTSIPDTSTAADLKAALEKLPGVGYVAVSTDQGPASPLCPQSVSPQTSITTRITFGQSAASASGDVAGLVSSDPKVTVVEVIKGVVQSTVGHRAYSALATGIAPNTPMYVRVASYNSVGDGGWTHALVPYPGGAEGVSAFGDVYVYPAQPMTLKPILANPVAPAAIRVDTVSATSLVVSFPTPQSASLGGGALFGYQVEADVSRSFDSMCGEAKEVQRIVFASSNFVPSSLIGKLSLSLTWDYGVAASAVAPVPIEVTLDRGSGQFNFNQGQCSICY